MSTPVIISGALGRMGREIGFNVFDEPSAVLAGAVEYEGHPQVGSDFGTCTGREPCGVTVTSDIADCPLEGAVVIDFSSPAATAALIDRLDGRGSRLVIGTTGLDAEIEKKIERFSKSHAVVYSPNMSTGVNLLFYLTRLVAEKTAGAFDIEIVEAHHRFKKDAPSGTAKELGRICAEAREQSYDHCVRDGRGADAGLRTDTEIGMHALRGGDIVGEHTVMFAGLGERVELRHVAHSRSTLSRGALQAALWCARQDAGLYSMQDVLGL